MNTWLVKSEPDVFSLDDLKKAPGRTTHWNGVRNHAAKLHLRAMRKGDLVFFYHSNAKPSAIVGIAEVVREAYPDPSQFDPKARDMGYDPRSRTEDPTWVMVDLRVREALPRPVALDEVKASPALRKMALVRIARLSVQPVTPTEWKAVLALAAKPAPETSARGPARKAAPRATRPKRRT